jgi:pheromone a factor receptor
MVYNAPVGVSDLDPAQFIIYPLCILCILIPAPVHFKSRNTGVILYIIYVLSIQIPMFVNAIIWRGNIGNPVPYWCDLTSFILSAAPSGMSAAMICVTRQLYRLAKAQAVVISQHEVRDFSLSLLLNFPLIYLFRNASSSR